MKPTIKIYWLACIGVMLLIISCSGDDSSVGPNPTNQAPGEFALVSVSDQSTGIDLLPTLEWEEAVDPEGDAVVYDLYIDKEGDFSSAYETDVSGTSYTVDVPLHLISEYQWKVIAKDGNGGETESADAFTFTTRNISGGTQVTDNAGFGGRSNHASAVFNNSIWVAGGTGSSFHYDDVWQYDLEGNFWTKATGSINNIEQRYGHTQVNYNNRQYVIAGSLPASIGYSNNIKVSEIDGGSNWTPSPDPGFDERAFHTSVIFDEKIWVIGGLNNIDGRLSDVWYYDGDDWTQATGSAEFGTRSGHSTVVFDNKLWLIGGYDGLGRRSDVWFSTDGVNWEQATRDAGFQPRNRHESVVYDGKIWVIAGTNGSGSLNDIWYSEDGINWFEAHTHAGFEVRHNHTVVVFDNKIWITGGQHLTTVYSDVWYLN